VRDRRDRRLAARARRQLGMFTRAQAIESGFPSETIRRRLRREVWEEIDTRVYRAATAARPDARRLLVDGMNHVLKLATLDPSDQQAAYTDPTLPLAPALLDGLLPYLRGVARP
jgi:hypothetical protein